MTNMVRPWMVFVALVACTLVCVADAYPPQPEKPGGNASPGDWDQYNTALRHYVNLITRQRYGKRASPEDDLAWLLLGAGSDRSPEPRSEYSDQW